MEIKPSSWYCENYSKVIQEGGASISTSVKSKGGNKTLAFSNQRELVQEFFKVLSLAHDCDVEHFTDKNGERKKFFNGPSPDEVALVEFASSMGFDCMSVSDQDIKLKASLKAGPGEYGFKVLRKMEFSSDRKRMSILLKDPTDGKIKLLTKGADSIIKSRMDASQFSSEMEAKIEWFLDTASRQGLRTLLMGMRVIEESELQQF